jgi:hypothetical protein
VRGVEERAHERGRLARDDREPAEVLQLVAKQRRAHAA